MAMSHELKEEMSQSLLLCFSLNLIVSGAASIIRVWSGERQGFCFVVFLQTYLLGDFFFPLLKAI